jgi:hypothetical protein
MFEPEFLDDYDSPGPRLIDGLPEPLLHELTSWFRSEYLNQAIQYLRDLAELQSDNINPNVGSNQQAVTDYPF